MSIDSNSFPMMQVLRFGIVGLISNLLIFLIYLALTEIGMGHKSAMTLLFVVGVAQTFVFNKRWTFGYDGIIQGAFLKYVVIYALVYLLNLTFLFLLVDILDNPHQVVQGLMILISGLILFLLQKFWVFRVHGAPQLPRQNL